MDIYFLLVYMVGSLSFMLMVFVEMIIYKVGLLKFIF